MSKQWKIGVYLDASKKKLCNWEECERFAKEHSILFLDLDGQTPLSEQGQYDLILCKLTKQIASQSDEAKQVIAHFEQFALSHPLVPFVDPVWSQRCVMSREDMGRVCNEVAKKIAGMIEIKSALISDGELTDKVKEFSFPMIGKSTLSGGCSESHEMGVVFNLNNLDRFKRPVLVQEYLNHDGIIFKIFVIGSELSTKVKASLPNFESHPDREPLMFNSQSFADICSPVTSDLEQEAQKLDMMKIRDIVAAIRELTGLTLFGFDVIVCSRTGQYALIDINYFPGYRGVEDFPQQFLAFLSKQIKDNAKWNHLNS